MDRDFVNETKADEIAKAQGPLLAVHVKIVQGPIRRDFRRRVDHDVPVRKLPLGLAGTFRAPVNDLPTGGRVDLQFHRIGLITGRVPAAITQVKRCFQVLILRVVKIGQEPTQQDQVSISSFLHVRVS